jgi:SPP1 family predicted phage head-tail adaptor
MRAGDYRDRVTIRSKNEIDDTHGGFADEAVIVARRISARVRPLAGRELDRAQQIDPRARYDVTLPFRTGLKAGLAVVHHLGREDDRTLEVVAPPIDVDNRHQELQLLCGEAAA